MTGMAALPDNIKINTDAISDKALTDASVLVKRARQHVERHREAKTRKSMRTRQRILEAARQLMIERGSDDFQMAEVSERCDMSKGALYYYFTDRDDIVNELIANECESFVAQVEDIINSSDSAISFLASLCELFAESAREGDALLATMYTTPLGKGQQGTALAEQASRISRLVEVQLERGKGEGVIRADVDSKMMAPTILGSLLVSSSTQALAHPSGFDVRDYAAQLLAFVIGGVGAEREA
jgi:AcrR family transcriptional regulator